METKKQPLKRGKFIPAYPVQKLEMVKENRVCLTKNIAPKMDSLSEFGWLDVIKVNRNGKILDGQHRFEAAIRMGEVTVPVYQLDWIGDDIDEICKVLRVMNNTTLNYKTVDYIKMYKDHKTPYHHLNKAIKENESLTVGNILTSLTGIGAINNDFKAGKISLVDSELSDLIITNLKWLNEKHGKINASRLRKIILFCHANKHLGKEFVTFIFERIDNAIDTNMFPESEIELGDVIEQFKSDYEFNKFDDSTDAKIENIKVLSQKISWTK